MVRPPVSDIESWAAAAKAIIPTQGGENTFLALLKETRLKQRSEILSPELWPALAAAESLGKAWLLAIEGQTSDARQEMLDALQAQLGEASPSKQLHRRALRLALTDQAPVRVRAELFRVLLGRKSDALAVLMQDSAAEKAILESLWAHPCPQFRALILGSASSESAAELLTEAAGEVLAGLDSEATGGAFSWFEVLKRWPPERALTFVETLSSVLAPERLLSLSGELSELEGASQLLSGIQTQSSELLSCEAAKREAELGDLGFESEVASLTKLRQQKRNRTLSQRKLQALEDKAVSTLNRHPKFDRISESAVADTIEAAKEWKSAALKVFLQEDDSLRFYEQPGEDGLTNLQRFEQLKKKFEAGDSAQAQSMTKLVEAHLKNYREALEHRDVLLEEGPEQLLWLLSGLQQSAALRVGEQDISARSKSLIQEAVQPESQPSLKKLQNIHQQVMPELTALADRYEALQEHSNRLKIILDRLNQGPATKALQKELASVETEIGRLRSNLEALRQDAVALRMQRQRAPEVKRLLAKGPEIEQRLEEWNAAGLRVNAQEFAFSLQVEVVEENLSMAEVASTVFGKAAEELTEGHYGLLLVANPQLREGYNKENPGVSIVPRGPLLLNAVPQAYVLQNFRLSENIVALRLALLDTPLDAPERSDMEDSLAWLVQQREIGKENKSKIRGLRLQLEVEHRLSSAMQEGDLPELTKVYEQALGKVEGVLPQSKGPERKALLNAQNQLRLSQGRALMALAAQVEGEHSQAAFDAATQVLHDLRAVAKDDDALRPVVAEQWMALGQIQTQRVFQKHAPSLQDYVKKHGFLDPNNLDSEGLKVLTEALAAVQELENFQNQALEEIHLLGSAHDDALKEMRAQTRSSFFLSSAQLWSLVGNVQEQFEALRAGLDQTVGLGFSELFEPDQEGRINKENEEGNWFTGVMVGSLSSQRLEHIAQTLKKLSPQQRDRAENVLIQMAGLHASIQDTGGAKVLSQVLQKIAKGDDRIIMETLFAQANAQMLAGRGQFDGALKTARIALTQVENMDFSSPEEKGEYRKKAAKTYGQLLAQAAQGEENRADRSKAAATLSEFRKKLEAQENGPLNRTEIAQLITLEATAHMVADQSKLEDILTHLQEKHGDIPSVQKSLKAWKENHQKGGAEAFFKVLAREFVSETAGEALLGGVGGAAGGAAIGAAVGTFVFPGVGTLVGAGLGSLVGGATGVGALKGRNLIRGFSHAWDAGSTGYTNLSWGELAMDVVMGALDIVQIVAPIKGVTSLGKGGLSAFLKGGKSAFGKELMAEVQTVAKKNLGKNAVEDLTEAELQRTVRTIVAQRFTKETFEFGGKYVMIGGLGAAAGPLGFQYYQIEEMPEGPAKTAALRNFRANLKNVAIMMGAFMSSAMLANKAVSSPRNVSMELRTTFKQMIDGPETHLAQAHLRSGNANKAMAAFEKAKLNLERARAAGGVGGTALAKARMVKARAALNLAMGKPKVSDAAVQVRINQAVEGLDGAWKIAQGEYHAQRSAGKSIDDALPDTAALEVAAETLLQRRGVPYEVSEVGGRKVFRILPSPYSAEPLARFSASVHKRTGYAVEFDAAAIFAEKGLGAADTYKGKLKLSYESLRKGFATLSEEHEMQHVLGELALHQKDGALQMFASADPGKKLSGEFKDSSYAEFMSFDEILAHGHDAYASAKRLASASIKERPDLVARLNRGVQNGIQIAKQTKTLASEALAKLQKAELIAGKDRTRSGDIVFYRIPLSEGRHLTLTFDPKILQQRINKVRMEKGLDEAQALRSIVEEKLHNVQSIGQKVGDLLLSVSKERDPAKIQALTAEAYGIAEVSHLPRNFELPGIKDQGKSAQGAAGYRLLRQGEDEGSLGGLLEQILNQPKEESAARLRKRGDVDAPLKEDSASVKNHSEQQVKDLSPEQRMHNSEGMTDLSADLHGIAVERYRGEVDASMLESKALAFEARSRLDRSFDCWATDTHKELHVAWHDFLALDTHWREVSELEEPSAQVVRRVGKQRSTALDRVRVLMARFDDAETRYTHERGRTAKILGDDGKGSKPRGLEQTLNKVDEIRKQLPGLLDVNVENVARQADLKLIKAGRPLDFFSESVVGNGKSFPFAVRLDPEAVSNPSKAAGLREALDQSYGNWLKRQDFDFDVKDFQKADATLKSFLERIQDQGKYQDDPVLLGRVLENLVTVREEARVRLKEKMGAFADAKEVFSKERARLRQGNETTAEIPPHVRELVEAQEGVIKNLDELTPVDLTQTNKSIAELKEAAKIEHQKFVDSYVAKIMGPLEAMKEKIPKYREVQERAVETGSGPESAPRGSLFEGAFGMVKKKRQDEAEVAQAVSENSGLSKTKGYQEILDSYDAKSVQEHLARENNRLNDYMSTIVKQDLLPIEIAAEKLAKEKASLRSLETLMDFASDPSLALSLPELRHLREGVDTASSGSTSNYVYRLEDPEALHQQLSEVQHRIWEAETRMTEVWTEMSTRNNIFMRDTKAINWAWGDLKKKLGLEMTGPEKSQLEALYKQADQVTELIRTTRRTINSQIEGTGYKGRIGKIQDALSRYDENIKQEAYRERIGGLKRQIEGLESHIKPLNVELKVLQGKWEAFYAAELPALKSDLNKLEAQALAFKRQFEEVYATKIELDTKIKKLSEESLHLKQALGEDVHTRLLVNEISMVKNNRNSDLNSVARYLEKLDGKRQYFGYTIPDRSSPEAYRKSLGLEEPKKPSEKIAKTTKKPEEDTPMEGVLGDILRASKKPC